MANLNSGQADLAQGDFTKAIELDPDYGEAYFNRGLAFSDLGQTQKASADFQKASQLWQQQGDHEASDTALQQLEALEAIK